MTASQHLDQARRALLTDQPTVAMLHMQRALHLAMVDGTQHWVDAFAARLKLPRGGVA